MMKKISVIVTIFSTLALLLAGCLSTSATTLHGPRIKLKNGTSTNWSGYAVETNLTSPQNNAVSDVKGQWTVPAVTCTSTNTYSSVWVGIDGYSDNTVEQTGTEQDCRSGTPTYFAWYELYPKFPKNLSMAIHPGDVMSAEVQYVGGGRFSLTIANTTTHTSFNTVQRTNAKRQSAEWIVEAPYSGGVLPLTNFGTINLTSSSATLNGVTAGVNSPNWQNDALTMAYSDGTIKAAPSVLSTDGQSFSVKWLHN